MEWLKELTDSTGEEGEREGGRRGAKIKRKDDEGGREEDDYNHLAMPNTFSECSGWVLPLLHQFTSLNIHTAQGLINPIIGDGREEKGGRMTTLSEGEMTTVSYLR